MTRKVYHVVPKGMGWSIRAEGAVRAAARFATKTEAVAAARNLAKSHPSGQLMVHTHDGHIEMERSYEKRGTRQADADMRSVGFAMHLKDGG